MSVVAETDEQLNDLARTTLVEMGEEPPDLPGEQSATADESEDLPLSWSPRGSWAWRGRSPCELGSDPNGNLILNLTVQTSRAPEPGELSKFAEKADDKARSAALFKLQSTPEWSSYIEGRAELNSAKSRLDVLEKESRDLADEHLRLASKPRGAGKRLAEIQERQEHIGKEKRGAEAEWQALQPIVNDGRHRAQEQARQIALDTAQAIRQEQQEETDSVLADFYHRHADELTAIAGRIAARSARSHDTFVAGLQVFVLARLESAQPAPEPADKTA